MNPQKVRYSFEASKNRSRLTVRQNHNPFRQSVPRRIVLRFPNLLLAAGMSMLLAACASSGSRMPIPLKDMASLLAEIHLGQGYFEVKGVSNPHWRDDSVPYNRRLVETMGYTWADFDSSLIILCADPPLFDKTYRQVTDRLNRMVSLNEMSGYPDTLLYDTLIYYPGTFRRDVFERNISSEKAGTYYFTAVLKVEPQDRMPRPLFSVTFQNAAGSGAFRAERVSRLPIRPFGQYITYRARKTLQKNETGNFNIRIFDVSDHAQADTSWVQYARIHSLLVTYQPVSRP